VLGLEESFQGICFGHAFFKAANILHIGKYLQRLTICGNQNCLMRFIEMHNLAKKI
jgi:hypothetical protein